MNRRLTYVAIPFYRLPTVESSLVRRLATRSDNEGVV